jgi:hypothetical protein
LSRTQRVDHYPKRWKRTNLFRERSEEGSDPLFVNRRAAILGQRVENLLAVCLLTTALLSTFPEEIRAADSRRRRRHGPRSHLHLGLGSTPSTASALSRPFSTSSGSIRILELVSTTFEPVPATACRSLIDSPGAVGATGLGRSRTGG